MKHDCWRERQVDRAGVILKCGFREYSCMSYCRAEEYLRNSWKKKSTLIASATKREQSIFDILSNEMMRWSRSRWGKQTRRTTQPQEYLARTAFSDAPTF